MLFSKFRVLLKNNFLGNLRHSPDNEVSPHL
jgi:hypothetical protein